MDRVKGHEGEVRGRKIRGEEKNRKTAHTKRVLLLKGRRERPTHYFTHLTTFITHLD